MLHFLDESAARLTPLTLRYDPMLVVLSCAIALTGAYAALRIARHLQHVDPGRRGLLLCGASLAMGMGVWAMHFIGMLALDEPFTIAYTPWLTIASIVPAILASVPYLTAIARCEHRVLPLASSGIAMGLGISLMHYLGMAAMNAAAEMRYDPLLFASSIVAAVVLATSTLFGIAATRSSRSESALLFPMSAAALGSAVSVMHYTGMAAVRFFESQGPLAMTGLIDDTPVVAAVSVGAMLLIAMASGSATIHLRLQDLQDNVRGRSEQLSAAMQGISEGFIMFDVAFEAIVWNKRLEDLVPALTAVLHPGLSYQQFSETLRCVSPHDQAAENSDTSECDRNRQISLPDGRWVQIRETLTPSNLLIVALSDITAHKRARARLRAFFDGTPYALVAIDKRYRIVHINRKALEVFGYASNDVLGQSCTLLAPEERRGKMRQCVDRCLEGEASASGILRDQDARAVRKSGEVFPVEVSFSVLDFGADPIVLFGLADLTERRRMEAQLHHSQKMEAVGQLTGGLAHDFNNLLTVVTGNLQLLETELGADSEAQEHVRDALEAAYRGSQLTKRLVAFARQQLLAPKILDVNQLIGELLPLLRKTMTPRVEVTTALCDELWRVQVDPTQLENALLNLALNALDAMPMGGALIIETRNVSLDERFVADHAELEAGDYVQVTVSDDGTGMPPDVTRRAFEPFFTTKESGRGTGLGLSMVYGFVKQSKGHIHIYSEIDHGTSVKIYLPRTRDADEEPSVITRTLPIVAGGHETILVVDDDAPVRKTVTTLLKNLGYSVIEAPNGREALELMGLHAEKIDLLLTDVVMPGGMSGFELATKARERLPSVKILLTSGYTQHSRFANELADSSFEVLNKPYQLADLGSKVRAVIDY